MKFTRFLKTTLVGGAMGLIPIVLAIIILKKAFVAIQNIITPWARTIGAEHVIGKLVIAIIAVAILVLICFIAGLVMRSRRFSLRFPLMDKLAAQIIPGFEIMRAQTNEKYGVPLTNPWQAIFLEQDKVWNIGFIVETEDGICTVFIPDAPKMDSGEVKIIAANDMHAIPIQAKEAYTYLKKFGIGASAKLSEVNQ